MRNKKPSAPWIYYGLILAGILALYFKWAIPVFRSTSAENNALIFVGMVFLTIIFLIVVGITYCFICDEWTAHLECTKDFAKKFPTKFQQPVYASIIIFPFIGLPIMFVYWIGTLIVEQTNSLIKVTKEQFTDMINITKERD